MDESFSISFDSREELNVGLPPQHTIYTRYRGHSMPAYIGRGCPHLLTTECGWFHVVFADLVLDM